VKTLDMVMAGAVKGMHTKSGNRKKVKQDTTIMVNLLDKGERAKGCNQTMWYQETLKVLKV
jgi:hypothetical protein